MHLLSKNGNKICWVRVEGRDQYFFVKFGVDTQREREGKKKINKKSVLIGVKFYK
jgi:hypothetical protein